MNIKQARKISIWYSLLFLFTLILSVVIGIICSELEIIWTTIFLSPLLIIIKLVTMLNQSEFIDTLVSKNIKKKICFSAIVFSIGSNLLYILPFLIVVLIVYCFHIVIFNIYMALAIMFVYTAYMNVVSHFILNTKQKDGKDLTNG